jgi:hypothetical protein
MDPKKVVSVPNGLVRELARQRSPLNYAEVSANGWRMLSAPADAVVHLKLKLKLTVVSNATLTFS